MKLEWLNDANKYISADIFVKHSLVRILHVALRPAAHGKAGHAVARPFGLGPAATNYRITYGA